MKTVPRNRDRCILKFHVMKTNENTMQLGMSFSAVLLHNNIIKKRCVIVNRVDENFSKPG